MTGASVSGTGAVADQEPEVRGAEPELPASIWHRRPLAVMPTSWVPR